MATFVTCSVEKLHRDYIGMTYNNPVNIDHCTELIKRDQNDGYGKSYPSIVFVGCDVIWYYYEGFPWPRDEDYNMILSTYRNIPAGEQKH